jgi:lysozyme family protein
MADFLTALPWVLNHEVIGWPVGEQDIAAGMAHVKALGHLRFWYTETPGDHGGATAWGLTLKLAQAYGVATKADLQAIEAERLAPIFRAEFWRYDGLNSQDVATKLLDLDVNQGLPSGVLLAQKALVALGVPLAEDGHFGPATETAINASSPAAVLDGLCREASDRYRAIVARQPDQMQFLSNWLHRAEDRP